jgi:transmembrane sensor
MADNFRRTEDDTADDRWDALARYVAGESEPAERSRVEAELAANPPRAALLAELKAALPAPFTVMTTAEDVERALASVNARRDDREARVVVRPIGNAPSLLGYRGLWRAARLRAAAAVLVVAAGALLARSFGRAPESSAVVGPGAERVLRTAVGAIDSVRLPDGSRVILGPASELRIAAGFGPSARAVTLRGEGYFDVVHDAAHPLVVSTESAELRDVGTAFTVRGEGRALKVVVASGAVALQPLARTIAGVTLHAGDRGLLTEDGQLRVESGVSLPEAMAWTERRLAFRDASVPEVASELRRWYGVELRVSDTTLRGRRLTASFVNETPGQVASVVAAALGGVPRLRGDTLWIDRVAAPSTR